MIDWAAYLKAGAGATPKVIEGIKSVKGILKKPDLLVIEPDWGGTQQRVWSSGVVYGVKQ